MNPTDTEILQKILTRNPEELNAYEIKFLNARRSYLNKEQRRIFASVLIDEAAPHILDENGNFTGDVTQEAVKQPETLQTAPVLTRKELEAKARELGVTEEAIKKAKRNSDLEALIASPVVAIQPEAPVAPAVDAFSGVNADPDSKV